MRKLKKSQLKSNSVQEKKPGGRPSDYTPELGRRICDEIAAGPRGITRLCEAHDDFPHAATAKRWLFQIPAFRAMYEEAKLIQVNLLAEELADIAAESDYYIDEKGNKKIDPPSVGVTRNRIDAMKWTAARLLPRKWGEQQKEIEDLSKKNEVLNQLIDKLMSEKKSEY